MTDRARRSGEDEFGFPRAVRITASEEIRNLFRRGKRKKTRHLDVFVSSSPASHPRLGLVVPKPRQKAAKRGGPVRGKAVRRNRVKRRLREIGRTVLLPRLREEERPMDVLIRARPEAYEASFGELKDQIEQLVEELCSHVA